MKNASWIAYCKITPADLFSISKLRGTHAKGGGQAYIDLSGNKISLSQWKDFFDHGVPFEQKQGPAWEVPVHSLGQMGIQNVRIAARTDTFSGKYRNMSIRGQKIHSKAGNRVLAWHPC